MIFIEDTNKKLIIRSDNKVIRILIRIIYIIEI